VTAVSLPGRRRHPIHHRIKQTPASGSKGLNMTANYSTDKKPTSPPPIEQYSEYRNTTRRGSEPAPPDAAKALRGTTTLEGIKQATEARRQQSRSWSTRDVGPQSQANHDSKRK
jgi:hypothetical protein